VRRGSALLVLDLQRDFLEDTGRMPVARDQVGPLLSAANALIDAAPAREMHLAYVLNVFPRSAFVSNFFRRGAAVAGTRGAELDPRVHVAGGVRFSKAGGDAFTNPALDAWLREQGVRELVVVGVFAPHCVRATVRGALERAYSVTVVSDGVAAGSERSRANAIAKVQHEGALVTTSSALLARGDRIVEPRA
jgi:nicotinamidase-related amidase